MKATVFYTLIALFTAVAVVSWFIGLSQGAQSNFFSLTVISLFAIFFISVVDLFKSIQD